VHIGTLFEESIDPIQVAQLVMEEDEQSILILIEEDQMEEIKLEFVVVEEESIGDSLLSFKGPDLVDESIMEENYERDLAVPTSPPEQQIEEFDLSNSMLEEE
ncbi:hypothetical protein KI387_003204, partial [Taxus chinensis]